MFTPSGNNPSVRRYAAQRRKGFRSLRFARDLERDFHTHELADVRQRIGWLALIGMVAWPTFIFTGLPIDMNTIHYFDVFNACKLGLICMATSLRAAYGKRTHLDAMMNLLTGLGYSCVATVQDLLEKEAARRA